jgi:integrase
MKTSMPRPQVPQALSARNIPAMARPKKASLLARTAVAPAFEAAGEVHVGLPEDPPPGLVRREYVIVDGEAHVTETLVRRLVEEGSDLKHARSYAEAVAATEEMKRKRGRRRKGPRLWARKGFIWIKDGSHRESTGYEVSAGSDYRFHAGALSRLQRYVDQRIRSIMGRVLKSEVSVAQAFAHWREHHKPGATHHLLDGERYAGICRHLKNFESFAADTTLDRLASTSGPQYANHYCRKRFGARKVAEEDLMPARKTACDHIDSVNAVLDWCGVEYGFTPTRLKKPKLRRRGVVTYTWEEVDRLIRAARGEVFDADGRSVGRHNEAARLDCVARYALLYLYGGVRGANILDLLWGKHDLLGHIDVERLEVERQGDRAEITSKRRYATKLLGSLQILAPQWEAEDGEARVKKPGRFRHVIHDENGKSLVRRTKRGTKSTWAIRRLFDRVRRYAKLPDVTAHDLKATGVTFCVRAGMPAHRVTLEFSTSWGTLWNRYVNLRPYLTQPRAFQEEDLLFDNLRQFSSSRDEEGDGDDD